MKRPDRPIAALALAALLGVAALAATRPLRVPPAAPAAASIGAAASFAEILREGRSSAIATVRLRIGPGDAERASLAANGVRLLAPLPGRRHVARLEGAALRLAATGAAPHSLVAETRRPTPSERADERVLSGGYDAFARVPGGAIALHASVAPDVPLPAAEAEAAAVGARVVGRVKSLHLLVLECPEAAVGPLLERDGTFLRVAQAGPALSPCNDGVRDAMGVPAIADPPLGLTGSGVKVLVFDQGLVSGTHPDLSGRVTAIESGNVTTHATHTAGTIAGAGTLDARYRGVAPDAEILSAAYPSCVPQCLYNNPQDLEEDYEAAHVGFGADLNSNSISTNVNQNGYPCEWQGAYETTSALLDSIVAGSLGPRVISVWAAGNERSSLRCGEYVTIGVPATAKNVISVGSVDSGDGSVSSFSSFGPTRDGRLKPDVVAPGCQSGGDGGVTSTVPPAGYGALCGTSMSAPAVAGLLALGLERHRQLRPSDPDPSPATMKALLCQSASETGAPGPDFESGFGAANGPALVAAIESGTFLESDVADRVARRYEAVVAPGDPELRVTLAWSDPAAALDASVQLVNDLDLLLVDPSGGLHRPLVLDPDSPASPAAPGVDRRNPIEQVRVAAPLDGAWRILVLGETVTTGNQAFGLVSSHALAAAPARDLATSLLAVDYDPSDADVDAGPGVAGQAANLVGTVFNAGALPITAARLRATAAVPGGGSVSHESLVTDFDAEAPGDQPLAIGASFTTAFAFAAGELASPGTYDLAFESVPGDLACDDGGATSTGDEIAFNDVLADLDDREASADDDVSPDALDLRTHSLAIALPPESLVIENAATEKVRLELRLSGLLPSGPRRTTEFHFDLERASGMTTHADARAIVTRQLKAVVDKSAELKVGLSGLVGIPRNSPLVIRVYGIDTSLDEVIVEARSPEFTVSP